MRLLDVATCLDGDLVGGTRDDAVPEVAAQHVHHRVGEHLALAHRLERPDEVAQVFGELVLLSDRFRPPVGEDVGLTDRVRNMEKPAVERGLLDVADDPARETSEHRAQRHVRLCGEPGIIGEHDRRRDAPVIVGVADVAEALEELQSERCGVLDDEVALVRHIVNVGISASCKAGMIEPTAVELARHARLERRPARIPLRKAKGVHVDEAIVGGAAWPLGMGDEALAIERPVDAQRGRHVEMHLVGVEEGNAACLPQYPLDRIVGERGFHLGQDFERRHAAEAVAEL